MHGLLKSQKNELFNTIRAYGLSPSDFRWSDFPELGERSINASGDKYAVLFYGAGMEYYFQFQIKGPDYSTKCVYSPGNNRPVQYEFNKTWAQIRETFEKWVSYLRHEINTPDLWETVSQEKELIRDAAQSSDDSFFTLEERKHLAISLNEIRQYLLTSFKVGEPQQHFINVRIQYLDDASQRLSKRDWKTIAVGTLLGLVVDLALEPARARELFRLAGNALSWLFGHGPGPNIEPPGSGSILI